MPSVRVGHGVGVAPAELHLLPASLISFCGAFNSIVTSCSQSVPLFGVCGVSAASSHLRLMRVGSACLAHHPTSGSYRLNKGLGAGLATIAAWLAFTLGLGAHARGVYPFSWVAFTSLGGQSMAGGLHGWSPISGGLPTLRLSSNPRMTWHGFGLPRLPRPLLGPWSPRHRSGLAHDVHVVSGPVGCEVMVFTLDPWMRP